MVTDAVQKELTRFMKGYLGRYLQHDFKSLQLFVSCSFNIHDTHFFKKKYCKNNPYLLQ